jgi:hypothetical protein
MKNLKTFEGYFGDGIETGYLAPKVPNPHVPKEIFDESDISIGKILNKRTDYKFKKIYFLTVQINGDIQEIEVEQNDYHNHKIGDEIKISQKSLSR